MMDQTQPPSLKTRLHTLLDRSWEIQKSFLSRLTETQRAGIGQISDWSTTSAKDVISHVTLWKRLAAERSRAQRNGETLSDPDALQINDDHFRATHTLSWTEVLAEAEIVHQAHIDLLNSFSEAELQADPFFRRFVGNVYLHPVQHFVDYALANGDPGQASLLSEQTVHDVSALGVASASHNAVYNLACFHARTGNSDHAIALLSEPLKNNPGLYEWAKEDPDLDSLRDLPAFKALYTDS